MRLSEIDFGAARPVEGYGPDFFRIGGEAHPAPLLIVPGAVRPWGGYDDPEALLALAGRWMCCSSAQVAGRAYPAPCATTLEAAGLGVEIMDSPRLPHL
jgi:uncharacterized protein